jgi:hypothetical protein
MRNDVAFPGEKDTTARNERREGKRGQVDCRRGEGARKRKIQTIIAGQKRGGSEQAEKQEKGAAVRSESTATSAKEPLLQKAE